MEREYAKATSSGITQSLAIIGLRAGSIDGVWLRLKTQAREVFKANDE